MLPAAKSLIRSVAPDAVLEARRRWKLRAIRNKNRSRSEKEIFREIYLENRWGGEPGTFCSGSGSTARHAELYVDAVKRFVREHDIHRVVDLGCGDFQIGMRLLDADIEYVGVDIVEELIQRNRQLYAGDRVRFECLNIIEDRLPTGDLCLIRQVLQHLSNSQIANVLDNVRGYRYVLVTEVYPAAAAEVAPNLDKPCGEDVRVYDGSAVYLDKPPFDRPVTRTVLDVEADDYLLNRGERIRTLLIESENRAG